MYLYTVSTQFPALFGMSIHHEYIIIISFFRVVFMQKGDVHEILTSYLLLFQLPGFADDDFWFRKIFTLVNPPFKDPQGIYQDFVAPRLGSKGNLSDARLHNSLKSRLSVRRWMAKPMWFFGQTRTQISIFDPSWSLNIWLLRKKTHFEWQNMGSSSVTFFGWETLICWHRNSWHIVMDVHLLKSRLRQSWMAWTSRMASPIHRTIFSGCQANQVMTGQSW